MKKRIYALALAFSVLLTAAPAGIERLSENHVLISLYIKDHHVLSAEEIVLQKEAKREMVTGISHLSGE